MEGESAEPTQSRNVSLSLSEHSLGSINVCHYRLRKKMVHKLGTDDFILAAVTREHLLTTVQLGTTICLLPTKPSCLLTVNTL